MTTRTTVRSKRFRRPRAAAGAHLTPSETAEIDRHIARRRSACRIMNECDKAIERLLETAKNRAERERDLHGN